MGLSGILGRGSAALAIPFLIAAAGIACAGPSGGSCYPGDRTSCACDGGSQGFQTCGPGGKLGACSCAAGSGGAATTAGSGGASSTGGSGGAGGGADGGLLPFLSPCTTSASCQTGLCFDFPTKGMHCTKPCTTPADCPPPSPGCSPQGVCRAL